MYILHTKKSEGIKEARHKRVQAAGVHLYEVQEHASLIGSGGSV